MAHGPHPKTPPPPGSPNRHDAIPPHATEVLWRFLLQGHIPESPESAAAAQTEAERNYERLLHEGQLRYPRMGLHEAAQRLAADEAGIPDTSSDSDSIVSTGLRTDSESRESVDLSQVVQGVPIPTGLPGAVFISDDEEQRGGWVLPDGVTVRTLPDGTQVFDGLRDFEQDHEIPRQMDLPPGTQVLVGPTREFDPRQMAQEMDLERWEDGSDSRSDVSTDSSRAPSSHASGYHRGTWDPDRNGPINWLGMLESLDQMRRTVPPEPGSHHDYFQQLAIMRIQDRFTAEQRGERMQRIDRSYRPGETRPEPDAEPSTRGELA